MDEKSVQLPKPLSIHSAKLKFTKSRGSRAIASVLVTIYNNQNNIIRKKDFKIPGNKKNPNYVDFDDLNWKRQTNEDVSKYFRTNNEGRHNYTDSRGIRAPLFLCSKLEEFVRETYLEKSEKT
jgi:hypothetical protein